MRAVVRLRRGRAAGDRGVTIVEAAFAFPILLMFMFGLADLGMWVFNSNQATNAARDGARLGIVDFETADKPLDVGSMHAAIVEAVEARLDRDVTRDQVKVRCVRNDGTAVACSGAKEDSDRIEVKVEWHWDLVTPVATILGQNRGAARGSATMVIAGRPIPPPPSAGGGGDGDDGTGTTTCTGSVLAVTSPVSRKNSSMQLQNSVQVKFTVSGTCPDVRVEFESPSGAKVPQIVCGCEPTPKTEPYLDYSYRGSDNIWTASSATAPAYVRVFDSGVEIASSTFTVL